jgi:hypothetical protein
MRHVVCGWYTPDYQHWWDKLRPSLERHGSEHDFIEVEKQDGGWEANTMAKSHQLLAAMDRHPDKVIVFLDVDCDVRAPIAPLADLVSADVGFYIRSKRSSSGRIKLGSIRSGTLVVRPTSGARAFVELWAAESKSSRWGEVDQDTMLLTIGKTHACSFQNIPVAYCATVGDKVQSPAIFHDSASRGIAKVGRMARRLHNLGAPRWVVNAMPVLRT